MIRGRCSCGGFQFEINGRASDSHRCPCSICREATGARAIAIQATTTKTFEWLCGEDTIRKTDRELGQRRPGRCRIRGMEPRAPRARGAPPKDSRESGPRLRTERVDAAAEDG